jgi:hypothetical protein
MHDLERAELLVDLANSRSTWSASTTSQRSATPPISSVSAASLSVLRAARPTLKPSRASALANEALMPSPAPTINPALAMPLLPHHNSGRTNQTAKARAWRERGRGADWRASGGPRHIFETAAVPGGRRRYRADVSRG